MKRRSKRQEQRAKKRGAREAGQRRPGGKSQYARKREYCMSRGVWGFDVPTPKPWRAS